MRNLSKNAGFSLTELLIAAVLGLLLLGGVIQLFIGSKQTYQMQDQLGNLQTDGRYALMFIQRLAENTGWEDDIALTKNNDAVSGSDTGGTYDEVTFRLYEMKNSLDCNGVPIVNDDVINRVYVSGTTLLCRGNGGSAAQPIIENVESFQVLYGVDSNLDGVVNGYMDASAVTDFKRVISLKIAVLIATQEDANNQSLTQNFDVLGEPISVADKKLRRLFIKTIQMPNQAYPIVRAL